MPDLSIITEGAINGNGIFDKLMQTTSEHINEQFGQGNIDSSAYAEVYVGSLNVILQQSIAYAMQNERQAEELKLIQAQTRLAEEQALTELSQRNKLLAETNLTEAQERGVEADILLTEARTAQQELESARYTDETPKYLDRLDKEILVLTKQNALTDEQILVAKQDVLKSQEEVKLIAEQVLVAKQEVLKSQKEVDLITGQITKVGKEGQRIDAEKALLDQKKLTEQGQTQDLTTGTIGAQQNLYKKQAEGFIEDAKVKKLKSVGDVYAVAKSNDPTGVTDPTNLISSLTSLINNVT